jgi:hypothetical protein
MIDKEGYRANIGIVITNDKKQILLAKRHQQDAWQLPQGGINKGESELEALFRELNEEIGLLPKHVDLVAKTPKWLRYDLPKQHIRHRQKPLCIGQSRNNASSSLSPLLMPPCGNCQASCWWRLAKSICFLHLCFHECPLSLMAERLITSQQRLAYI